VRPPLVLEVKGTVTVAVPVAPDGMPEKSLMLTDVPPLLPPPRHPLHDLPRPLSVVLR